MGSILAAVVIEKAAVLLVDSGHKVWSKKELLGWLNDGQLAIVGLRPDAKARVRPVQLVAGTKQSIAAPDLRILNVVRNLGADGTVPGRVVTFTRESELNAERPNWHGETAHAVARYWTHDDRTPEVWWCYPPQPATPAWVELVTSCTPTACTIQGVDSAAETTAIDIADIYLNPLVAFIVMRAHMRDDEYSQPGGKAALAQAEFFQLLGIKLEADKRNRPQKAQPPHHDPRPPGDDGPMGDR